MPEPGAAPALQSLRDDAVRTVTWVVLGLGWTFLLFVGVVDPAAFRAAIVPLGIPVVLASLLAAVKASYRVRSWFVISIAASLSCSSLLRFGPSAGAYMLAIAAAVLAAAFLGRRAAFLVMAGVLGVAALSATLFFNGVVEPVLASAFDPTVPRNWLRTGIVFVSSSLMAVLAVSYLMQSLEQAVAARDRLVDELRAEQVKRQALEEERTRERLALAETQKLEAVGRLAGGIAHDFRNMLGIIRPWLDVMRARRDLATLDEGLDAIGDAVALSTDVTTQLLSIARRQPGAPEVLHLEELVKSWVSGFGRVALNELTVETRLAPTPSLFLDRAELHRVLLNLCLNAREAMPQGGKLTLETAVLPAAQLPAGAPVQGRDHVVLVVQDEGGGIDEATRRQMFEPFFTTRGASGGTGLGLATVRGVVEQARGFVEVTSEVGQGARFVVGFPVPESLPQVAVAPVTAPAPVAVSQARVVLVVDDEPMVARAVGRLFHALGYEAVLQPNADDALKWLEQGKPVDLVSTDGRMPGLRVVEFLRIVRERWPKLPVMVCSGFMDEDLLAQQTARKFAWLAKPFDRESIEKTVRDAFERTGQLTG